MPLSNLTDSTEELVGGLITVLEAEGYVWNRKTTSFSEYLATALTGIGGSTVSHLTMSTEDLLAGLANETASTYSSLTTGVNDLLEAIANGSFGADWLLSDGAWNDSGVWDDAAAWNDAA